MLSAQQLLQAYGLPGSPGGGGLAFFPALVGLIRPGASHSNPEQRKEAAAAPAFLEFARPELCTFWIPIPIDLIDHVEMLGKRACGPVSYDYARITFKLPATPEGKFSSALLLSQQSTQEEPHTCACKGGAYNRDLILGGQLGCLTISVKDRKACANIAGYDFCVDVPDFIQDGTTVQVCLYVCGARVLPKGVRAEVYFNGQRVACKTLFGDCDC